MRFHTEILLHLLNILIVLAFKLLNYLNFTVSLYIHLNHQVYKSNDLVFLCGNLAQAAKRLLSVNTLAGYECCENTNGKYKKLQLVYLLRAVAPT